MIYILLVIYQLKHFICDFPLQNKYMLGKFKGGYEWILPLAAHASVHGVFTFLIALFFKPNIAFYVALFDMLIHFTMDRIKASPDMLGRFKPVTAEQYVAIQRIIENEDKNAEMKIASESGKKRLLSNTYFWWSLGLDQFVHHLTHYAIIWYLLK